MEKSAKSIARSKFQKLSIRQQHKVLAALASEALVDECWGEFSQRYAQLHQWVGLDKYQPPSWLKPREAVLACRDFHLLFAEIPLPVTKPCANLWAPSHAVEVVVDQVRTPYNIGSILRLIDNFGFQRLVHATPWLRWDHPRLVRAARGCQAWVPIHFEANLPAYLSAEKRPVFALEAADGAMDINAWQPPPACVLVLGSESYGVSQAIRDCCDGMLQIPMYGFKHSMNVTHALAVVAQFWLNRQSSTCHGSPSHA